jgi:large subunit ribosomal protein L4
MAKAKFYAADGSAKSEMDLPETYFGAAVSEPCMYLAVNAYLTNQRQGTSKAQSKSEVSGTGAKPWKQKGTGRARAGSNKSPIWVRGAVAHGPKPRYYYKKVNKKVKQRALLSALTTKATEGLVSVIENLKFEAPKTKAFLDVVNTMGLAGKSLVLVAPGDENCFLSARNDHWSNVMRVEDVNTYSILKAKNVVFTEEALKLLTGGEK